MGLSDAPPAAAASLPDEAGAHRHGAACGGWDDPATARAYRQFERRHGRYRHASRALVRHAALAPGLRVLDLAAGTGATALALLEALGPTGRGGGIDCVEPSAAMRDAGRQRLGDREGLRWLASLAEADARYDRITCSAAIWQWADVPALLQQLAARLAPGGALVFNIPAAYLGHADGPGGGRDPWLTELPQRLGPPAARAAWVPGERPLTVPRLEAGLRAAGLHAERWQQRLRLSQAAWVDWHRIPVITDARWPGVDAAERARRIDAAAEGLDPASWRPETWFGWTAWKPPWCPTPLPDMRARGPEAAAPREAAHRDGVLLLRGLLPPGPLRTLRRRMQHHAQALALVDARGRWIGPDAAAPHEIGRWVALQQRVANEPAFQALVHDARVTALLSRVTGHAMQGGRGAVCRIAPPEHRVPATPPHRDAEFLPVADGVWGAWVPLSPCGVHDGVLAVAPGSHRDPASTTWAAAPMDVGDVLLLSARTLHRGCANLRLHEPRWSVDLRYGPA